MHKQEMREVALARVKKGTERLDQDRPGALRGVDLNKMTLHSPQFCVLGMIYGSFSAGCTALGFSQEDAIEHGFVDTLKDGILGSCWRAEIANRQGFVFWF